MKAYLIDPKTKEITEIEHDEKWESLYPIVGYDNFEVVTRLVGVGIRDALLVDQNGQMMGMDLRAEVKKRGAFIIKGQHAPVIGRAIFSGHTRDGEMCDPKTSVKTLKGLLMFLD